MFDAYILMQQDPYFDPERRQIKMKHELKTELNNLSKDELEELKEEIQVLLDAIDEDEDEDDDDEDDEEETEEDSELEEEEDEPDPEAESI